MFELIRSIVRVLSLALWATVGLVFWIPRLIIAIGLLLFGSIAAALTNSDMSPLRERLEKATEFYPDGFSRINSALGKEVTPSKPGAVRSPISWDRVVFEIIEAALFWTAIYITVKVL